MTQISNIIKKAYEEFRDSFGEDSEDFEVFRDRVVRPLLRVYGGNSEKLDSRLNEIIDNGYNKATDLGHYLDVACIGEGEDRPLTYEEAVRVLGERPVEAGDKIYNFSNRELSEGYKGHKRMCFTSEGDITSVESESIDLSVPLYKHTCEVVDPSKILDHTAIAKTGAGSAREVIEDVLLSGDLLEDFRWYEASDVGAIRVTEVKRI